MIEAGFHLREDWRRSLPSDHNALVAVFSGRTGLRLRPPRPRHGCGRWGVIAEPLQAAAADASFTFSQDTFASLCQQHSYRLPSRRYRDPPEIKELIRLRKVCAEPPQRESLAQQIAQERSLAQKRHKLDLLEAARAGDRGAIGHLRRSSAQSYSDGSLLERLGGHDQACDQVKSFYQQKYSRSVGESEVTSVQKEALEAKHAGAPFCPVTDEEIRVALSKVKTSTATGLDSVCYTAIQAFHQQDTQGKLASFFSRILGGEVPVPKEWLIGKICLIPKVQRPSRVQDLRPISLTPCLGKLFSKIIMQRLRRTLPPFQAGQHANRPGTQALEAVVAAQSTMKLYKQATGKRLLACKLDIKQAFDTVSHQAVWRYLYDAEASRESLVLWQLCCNTEVRLQLGSRSWSQELERGLLQGTSYSADLFSRIIDHFLGGLLRRWQASEHEVFTRYDLPHALLFADDILLFGTDTKELQIKLRDLQLTLESIGLQLNLSKCNILDDEDGTTPGIWGRNAAAPIAGAESILYLGVPLCYGGNALGGLGVSLAKMSSAFFGLRRLFDHPDTPVSEKLLLFQTYITSKWSWCAPAVYPSVQALRSLESFKHTLLLSLLKLQVDPLQPFLANVLARRRAVKVTCEVFKSVRWGELWLTRLWNFWGHVFRSKADLPIHRIVSKCATWRIVTGRTQPGPLTLFTPRKLQLAWNKMRGTSPWPDVESLAQERPIWTQALKDWLRKWGYTGPDRARMPANYLCDRQLLLVGKALAILRPARLFPEEPYSREVQHVLRGVPRTTQWTLWISMPDQGIEVRVIPPKRSGGKVLVIQANQDGSQGLLHRRLQVWESIRQVWLWMPFLWEQKAAIFLPPGAFASHIWCQQVPLDQLWRANRLHTFEVNQDLLSFCFLHPKKTPDWLVHQLQGPFGPFPDGRSILTRHADFSHAVYHAAFPLHFPFPTVVDLT
ncbi:unnamed protein product [Symbiodinium sp. CCMP2592]|nr:unnamed protein product [Symbiodinium sp. CCMP2592]